MTDARALPAMPSRRQAALHLWAVLSFAVAQPVYDLVAANDGFLQAHQAGLGDMFAMVVVFSLLVPALPVLLFLAADWLRKGLGQLVFYPCLILALVAVFLPLMDRYVFDVYLYGYLAAAVTALALAAAYRAYALPRQYCTVLALGIPAFPLYFLVSTPLGRHGAAPPHFTAAQKARVDTHVVLVLFDEFPTLSLLDTDLRIDPVRFPHLAAFADQATFYRNAGAVSDDTLMGAVPAVLTGLPPDTYRAMRGKGVLSFFDLFDARYAANISEPLTSFSQAGGNLAGYTTRGRLALLFGDTVMLFYARLAPPDVKKTVVQADTWTGIARFSKLGAFFGLADGDAGDPGLGTTAHWPSFVTGFRADRLNLGFIHLVLPHHPWRFLADGTHYDTLRCLQRPTVNTWLLHYQWQMHLLQVGLVDTLVGELTAQLQAAGVYDDTLIILAADHGASFVRTGNLRKITPENYTDLVAVPLLIKYPGQTAGAVDDRMAETTDILPTVLDVLGLPPVALLDGGRSLRQTAPASRGRRVFAQHLREGMHRVQVPDNLLPDLRRRIDARNRAIAPGPLPGWRGPHDDLLGLAVDDLPSAGRLTAAVTQRADHAPLPLQQTPAAPVCMLNVDLVLKSRPGVSERYLAVAFEGRLVGYAPACREDQRERASLILPAAWADLPADALTWYWIEQHRHGRKIYALDPVPPQGT